MNARRAASILLLMAAGGGAAVGCVRRTLTIDTEPQGALVFLNDEEVGRTPVNVDFTWYGDYDIIIRKDGYQTLQTHARIVEPWYQIPPVDLFAESFWPGEVHDRHALSYTLAPYVPADRAAVLERAEELRTRTLFETD